MKKPAHEYKDEVLQFIINQLNGRNKASIQHKAFQSNFDIGPRDDLFSELLRSIRADGYLFVEGEFRHWANYTITIEGYAFVKNGGYTQQHKDHQKEKSHKAKEYLLLHWKVKWFWASIFMSIIALLISVLGLIFG